ncbi:MAG: protein translocase subunit SecF [Patescibacteria group bacterium]|mgnify:CR=1 FL=1
MFIIRHRKIFFIFTLVLVLFSVGSMIARGFNFGIDFTGGSILEVSYENARPDLDKVKEKLDSLAVAGGVPLGVYSLRPSGDMSYVLRTKEISNETKNKVFAALLLDGQAKAKEDRFNTIGPTVGGELRNKAYMAIAVTILGIVFFVTFAFRKVSRPVSSWKYGLATIIALIHDVVISAGVFIFLTPFIGAELDLLFMTALLAILGYSVHDTIVVFDRIRENLRVNNETHRQEPFEGVVGRSVTQTMGRSINTSLTIVLVLVALYFLGGESTRDFALLLTIGVIIGTYSSIFIASPLLTVFERMKKRS